VLCVRVCVCVCVCVCACVLFALSNPPLTPSAFSQHDPYHMHRKTAVRMKVSPLKATRHGSSNTEPPSPALPANPALLTPTDAAEHSSHDHDGGARVQVYEPARRRQSRERTQLQRQANVSVSDCQCLERVLSRICKDCCAAVLRDVSERPDPPFCGHTLMFCAKNMTEWAVDR
jgi:hypothetical protein